MPPSAALLRKSRSAALTMDSPDVPEVAVAALRLDFILPSDVVSLLIVVLSELTVVLSELWVRVVGCAGSVCANANVPQIAMAPSWRNLIMHAPLDLLSGNPSTNDKHLH